MNSYTKELGDQLSDLERENEKLRAEIKTLKPPKWLNEEAERRIADYDRMREENAALKAEVQRLRGALEWYALSRHDLTDASEAFEGPEILITQLYNYGQRARLALQATESEKKP